MITAKQMISHFGEEFSNPSNSPNRSQKAETLYNFNEEIPAPKRNFPTFIDTHHIKLNQKIRRTKPQLHAQNRESDFVGALLNYDRGGFQSKVQSSFNFSQTKAKNRLSQSVDTSFLMTPDKTAAGETLSSWKQYSHQKLPNDLRQKNFSEMFFNSKRTNKKREIMAVSLHNYPKNIFGLIPKEAKAVRQDNLLLKNQDILKKKILPSFQKGPKQISLQQIDSGMIKSQKSTQISGDGRGRNEEGFLFRQNGHATVQMNFPSRNFHIEQAGSRSSRPRESFNERLDNEYRASQLFSGTNTMMGTEILLAQGREKSSYNYGVAFQESRTHLPHINVVTDDHPSISQSLYDLAVKQQDSYESTVEKNKNGPKNLSQQSRDFFRHQQALIEEELRQNALNMQNNIQAIDRKKQVSQDQRSSLHASPHLPNSFGNTFQSSPTRGSSVTPVNLDYISANAVPYQQPPRKLESVSALQMAQFVKSSATFLESEGRVVIQNERKLPQQVRKFAEKQYRKSLSVKKEPEPLGALPQPLNLKSSDSEFKAHFQDRYRNAPDELFRQQLEQLQDTSFKLETLSTEEQDEKMKAFRAVMTKKLNALLARNVVDVFDGYQARELYNIIQKKVAEQERIRDTQKKHAQKIAIAKKQDKIRFMEKPKEIIVVEEVKETPSTIPASITKSKTGRSTSKKLPYVAGDQTSSSKGSRKNLNSFTDYIVKKSKFSNKIEKYDESDSSKGGLPRAADFTTKVKPSDVKVAEFMLQEEEFARQQRSFERETETFTKDVFDLLKADDQHEVFRLLDNVRWDIKMRIQKDQLAGIYRKYPGQEGKYEEIRERLRVESRKPRQKKSLVTLQLERIFGEDLDGVPDQLLDILYNSTEAQYKEIFAKMWNDVFIKDKHNGALTSMEATHNLDLAGISLKNKKLKNYIQYLIGETRNKNFVYDREAFSQSMPLNTKSLVQNFEEYVRGEDNTMKTVVNDIIERVDYNSVIQKYDMPASAVVYKDNPKYAFFKVCAHDKDLALPLLAKVVNKQLSLSNYMLQSGHILALARTFDFNPWFLQFFYLENNGLLDQDVANLFEGMQKLESVNSVVIKNNEFGPFSLAKIPPLLRRPPLQSLTTLKLISCKIHSFVSETVIQHVREQGFIRSLSLVDAKLKEPAVNQLALLVANSETLRELDISWNLLKTFEYAKLFNALTLNRTLTSLNLSCNKIVDSQETIEENETLKNFVNLDSLRSKFTDLEGEIQFQEEHSQTFGGLLGVSSTVMNLERNTPRNLKNVRYLKAYFESKVRWSKLTEDAMTMIMTFIKRNKNLQHLNLASVGLTEMMIAKIGKAMRRAKSLLSIHLCENVGVTPFVKCYLREILSVKKKEKQGPKIKLQDFHFKATKTSANEVFQSQLRSEIEDQFEKPIAREFIKLKQIFDRKRIHSDLHKFTESSSDEKRLIIQRVLGHAKEIPFSGQWRLCDSRQELCWICDQELYSLIFFDQDSAIVEQNLTSDPKVKNFILRKVREAGVTLEKEEKVAERYPDVPIIFGDFTNWNPVPMKGILEYCENLSNKHMQTEEDRTVFRRMMKDNCISFDQMSKETLPQHKRALYKVYEEEYKSEMISEWKKIIAKEVRFKKPHIVNASKVPIDAKVHSRLFVLPQFLKTGKHEFIVRYPDSQYPDLDQLLEESCKILSDDEDGDDEEHTVEWHQKRKNDRTRHLKKGRYLDICDTSDEEKESDSETQFVDKSTMFQRTKEQEIRRALRVERQKALQIQRGPPQYYVYQTIVDIRTEKIPMFVKETRRKAQVVRSFHKPTSVFAPWIEDNARILRTSFATDQENWKVHKLVKDEEDYKNILTFIGENFAFLKDVYVNLQIDSAFPFIQMTDISQFCEKCVMIDDNFKLATVDLMFISTLQKTKGTIKNKAGLIRCEFLEFLVRVAKWKYLDTGLAQNYTDALKLLFSNNIKPNYEPQEWQGFRANQLWNLTFQDIIFVNLEAFNKVHKYYFTPTQKFMSRFDAMHLMTRDTTLMMTSKEANYCLGYCKMTCIDESFDHERYLKLELVELFEMIGRIAHIKFKGTEHESKPLSTKFEMVLDIIFKLVEATRKEVVLSADSQSESDDEY